MQSKNLKKRKIERFYEMDVESDRYRECLNDGDPFMANHRNEKHCSPECADEYHNLKKKRKREELQKMENEQKILIEENQILSEKGEKNLKILNQLLINDWGSNFNMEYLYSLGFDFLNCNGRGELYNINPELNCHFLQMGTYRIYRVEFSEVLIKKIN